MSTFGFFSFREDLEANPNIAGRQAKKGSLPIRIYGMPFFDENGPYWGDEISPFMAKGDERLSARSVNIFADGVWSTVGDWVQV